MNTQHSIVLLNWVTLPSQLPCCRYMFETSKLFTTKQRICGAPIKFMNEISERKKKKTGNEQQHREKEQIADFNLLQIGSYGSATGDSQYRVMCVRVLRGKVCLRVLTRFSLTKIIFIGLASIGSICHQLLFIHVCSLFVLNVSDKFDRVIDSFQKQIDIRECDIYATA